jgi:hypothetical protein
MAVNGRQITAVISPQPYDDGAYRKKLLYLTVRYGHPYKTAVTPYLYGYGAQPYYLLIYVTVSQFRIFWHIYSLPSYHFP